jgi:hypothetical protein
MTAITINGKLRHVGSDVSYTEITKLAYIIDIPRLVVAYRHPTESTTRDLTRADGRVKVQNGTTFFVKQAEEATATVQPKENTNV